MLIGYLKSDDPRIPFSESSIAKLKKKGFDIKIDSSFGPFPDIESQDKTSLIKEADFVVSASPLSKEMYDLAKSGAHIISIFAPYHPDFDTSIVKRSDVNYYSLDMIPRSTLAQSVDVLSSMASLAGYSAVLLAADKLPRQIPLMMTAAGTIKPANILVLGAGVAGLQAIATAKRLGGRIEAFDVRSAVKEEVESLGAKFIEVPGAKDDIAAGGYAVLQTPEYIAKQKAELLKSLVKTDIVITTAQVRGRKAPTLIDDDMVSQMPKGAVIIDMASSTGGNVTCSVDKKEITKNGVTIIGDSSLYLRCLDDASSLLANNFANYISFFSISESRVVDNTHEILSTSNITGYSKK